VKNPALKNNVKIAQYWDMIHPKRIVTVANALHAKHITAKMKRDE
jgi:hypothetical protein